MQRLLLAALLAASTTAQQPVVTATGENMRLLSSSVSGSNNVYTITASVSHDNGNSSLPATWRRWWHFQVGNLSPLAAKTLTMRIQNAEYSDVILPAWSQSTDGGQTFGPWTRVPTSATPQVSGTTHTFTLSVAPAVTTIRLAKYFPYTVTDKNALLARIANHPSGHVRAIQSLGTSWQGRPIELVELTDRSVPDAGKRRVWIHSGIHPAENTSYFIVEGLIDWLLSGSPQSELLLDRLIVDIVPMANPDGVFLGNYRTNSRSVNLEDEWVAPYSSPEREIIALRTRIESLMGTTAAPGQNPIEVLLNLHATHNVAYPFHFEHVANPSFNLVSNRSGVIPAVNALERSWIAEFKAASPLVARGTTQSSTLSAPTRPFVESMMHDRWSIDPAWTGPPNHRPLVMAITLEGTYGRAADGVTWNTQADYRTVGAELGQALGGYFAFLPGGTVTRYGTPCLGPDLTGNLLQSPDRLSLTLLNAKPAAPLWLVLGLTQQSIPLPPPTLCPLRTELAIVVPGTTSAIGLWTQTLTLPNVPTLSVKVQTVVADIQGATVHWTSSNGLDVVYVR